MATEADLYIVSGVTATGALIWSPVGNGAGPSVAFPVAGAVSTPYFNSSVSSTSTPVKATSGILTELSVDNEKNSVTTYLQGWDGTTQIFSYAAFGGASYDAPIPSGGIKFTTNLTIIASTAVSTAVAPANPVLVNGAYR